MSLRTLFPHPGLTLLLTFVWLMLYNTITLGTIVFGFIMATIIPIVTAPYWPNRPKVKNLPMNHRVFDRRAVGYRRRQFRGRVDDPIRSEPRDPLDLGDDPARYPDA